MTSRALQIDLLPVLDVRPPRAPWSAGAAPSTAAARDANLRRAFAAQGVALEPLYTGSTFVPLSSVMDSPRRSHILATAGGLAAAASCDDLAPLPGGFALRVDGVLRFVPARRADLGVLRAWLAFLETPASQWQCPPIGLAAARLRVRDGLVDISCVEEHPSFRRRTSLELSALREAAARACAGVHQWVTPVAYALRHWTAFEPRAAAERLLGLGARSPASTAR